MPTLTRTDLETLRKAWEKLHIDSINRKTQVIIGSVVSTSFDGRVYPSHFGEFQLIIWKVLYLSYIIRRK
jgi:hypothetical protein